MTAKYTEGGQTVKVVISGLSNTYSDYITTYEEYQVSPLAGSTGPRQYSHQQ